MTARLKTIRWLLVIPIALLADLGSQSVASGLLVGSLEVLHNARFAFRPFIDEFIWQAWAPVWFVWAGTKVAPSYRFQTSLALAGFKAAIALYNSIGLLRYIHSGGSWVALDEVTQAPLWWNLSVEMLGLVGITLIAFTERKEGAHSEWGYVPKLFTTLRYDLIWYGVLAAWVALDHIIPNANGGFRNIQMLVQRWKWACLASPCTYLLICSILASVIVPLQLTFLVPRFFDNRREKTFFNKYGRSLLAVLGILVATVLLRLIIWGAFPIELDTRGVESLRLVPFVPFPTRPPGAWKW